MSYPPEHYRPFGTGGLAVLLVIGFILLGVEECAHMLGF